MVRHPRPRGADAHRAVQRGRMNVPGINATLLAPHHSGRTNFARSTNIGAGRWATLAITSDLPSTLAAQPCSKKATLICPLRESRSETMFARITGAGTPLARSTCHFFSEVFSPAGAVALPVERSNSFGKLPAGCRFMILVAGGSGLSWIAYPLLRHADRIEVKVRSAISPAFRKIKRAVGDSNHPRQKRSDSVGNALRGVP